MRPRTLSGDQTRCRIWSAQRAIAVGYEGRGFVSALAIRGMSYLVFLAHFAVLNGHAAQRSFSSSPILTDDENTQIVYMTYYNSTDTTHDTIQPRLPTYRYL